MRERERDPVEPPLFRRKDLSRVMLPYLCWTLGHALSSTLRPTVSVESQLFCFSFLTINTLLSQIVGPPFNFRMSHKMQFFSKVNKYIFLIFYLKSQYHFFTKFKLTRVIVEIYTFLINPKHFKYCFLKYLNFLNKTNNT